MSYEDKKVEEWSQEEYREFWSNFVEEQIIYRCVLCESKIPGDVETHMESNHSEKYRQHNQSLEGHTKPSERPEKKLTEVDSGGGSE